MSFHPLRLLKFGNCLVSAPRIAISFPPVNGTNGAWLTFMRNFHSRIDVGPGAPFFHCLERAYVAPDFILRRIDSNILFKVISFWNEYAGNQHKSDRQQKNDAND